MGSRFIAITGPVSSPSSMRMRVTPVSVSPCAMAHWMGAAPRKRGSSEACTLTLPMRRHLQHILGEDASRRPSPRTRRAPACAAPRRTAGCAASRAGAPSAPRSSASAFTGEMARALPRPLGLSGWVTTATTSPTSKQACERRHGELGRAHEDDAGSAHTGTLPSTASRLRRVQLLQRLQRGAGLLGWWPGAGRPPAPAPAPGPRPPRARGCAPPRG